MDLQSLRGGSGASFDPLGVQTMSIGRYATEMMNVRNAKSETLSLIQSSDLPSLSFNPCSPPMHPPSCQMLHTAPFVSYIYIRVQPL